MRIILKTDRIYLREIDENDYEDLCEMLKDKDVMYAWEHSFSDEECKNWLEKQINRYKEYGFGYWAIIEKKIKEIYGTMWFDNSKYQFKRILRNWLFIEEKILE